MLGRPNFKPGVDDPYAGKTWTWQDTTDFNDDGTDYHMHPDPDAAWAEYCAWLLIDGKSGLC